MLFVLRHISRVALMTCAAMATSLPPVSAGADLTAGPELTSSRPEVRLRKLHLVRPDLIPYPIAYEVFC